MDMDNLQFMAFSALWPFLVLQSQRRSDDEKLHGMEPHFTTEKASSKIHT